MNNDDVLDLTHIIRNTDEEPVSLDNMEEWKDMPAASTALDILQRLSHLDGKSRRRIRREQERKHKKK